MSALTGPYWLASLLAIVGVVGTFIILVWMAFSALIKPKWAGGEEVKERGLYEGLGLDDSARTRRPQKKALTEACKPVSRAEFDALMRRVEALEHKSCR